MRSSIIRDRSFKFALRVIRLHRELLAKKEYVISKQLLRSSTSIGANVEEASAAQSQKDFLHKMSIASKEARETLYWLKLLGASGTTGVELRTHIQEAKEIADILAAIVRTTTRRMVARESKPTSAESGRI